MSKAPRKGIILAGGAGTRLHPITLSQSKQLLPVYDKPMIYYPLATLMSAGIREFLIITTPRDQAAFRDLLGDGEQWGVSFEYAVQAAAERDRAGTDHRRAFLDGAPSALILGDNIFYGANLSELLQSASRAHEGRRCSAITCRIPSATAWSIRRRGKVTDLLEKPARPPSNYAVTGIYFYDARATALAQITAAIRARGAGDHRPEPRLPAARRAAASSGWAAARPGSIPARTTRCSMPACSCASSRSARASRWRASRKSPGAMGFIDADAAPQARQAAREERLRRISLRIVNERGQP